MKCSQSDGYIDARSKGKDDKIIKLYLSLQYFLTFKSGLLSHHLKKYFLSSINIIFFSHLFSLIHKLHSNIKMKIQIT